MEKMIRVFYFSAKSLNDFFLVFFFFFFDILIHEISNAACFDLWKFNDL